MRQTESGHGRQSSIWLTRCFEHRPYSAADWRIVAARKKREPTSINRTMEERPVEILIVIEAVLFLWMALS